MRLIDADALLNKCAECQKNDPLFEGRGWASHFINDAGEPSTEWYCVEDMIENTPTIDAIPVEWLEDKELDYRTTGDKMFSDAFAVVIAEWQ